jgi:hypothetical protein
MNQRERVAHLPPMTSFPLHYLDRFQNHDHSIFDSNVADHPRREHPGTLYQKPQPDEFLRELILHEGLLPIFRKDCKSPIGQNCGGMRGAVVSILHRFYPPRATQVLRDSLLNGSTQRIAQQNM